VGLPRAFIPVTATDTECLCITLCDLGSKALWKFSLIAGQFWKVLENRKSPKAIVLIYCACLSIDPCEVSILCLMLLCLSIDPLVVSILILDVVCVRVYRGGRFSC
jgi:hypothetical protein